MPDFESAVAGFLNWPDVPVGWTRHMRIGQPNEYPHSATE